MRPRGMLLVALAVGSTLGVLPAAAPAIALAQVAPSVESPAAPAQTTPAVSAEASAPPAQAAPVFAREQAPRTLRAYWHVFAAFGIAWLLLFGYALALGRRFARIERSLDAVRGGATA